MCAVPGYLDDGKTKANAVVEMTFGATTVKTDVAANNFRFVCDGPTMTLSLRDPTQVRPGNRRPLRRQHVA